MGATPNIGWFDPGSLSFELAKGIPAAFVALVIGVFAGWIAYRQAQIAHAKLKLDLFGRRYELYVLLWSFLSTGWYVPPPDRPEEVREYGRLRAEFINSIPQAYFLFGPDIGEYFDLVLQKSLEASAEQRKLHDTAPESPDRSGVEASIASLEQWKDAATRGLKARFIDLMSFDRWRG